MALGAGLDALFEDNTLQDKEAQTLRMSEIEPNKLQPRKSFDEEAIQGLAESIREHGLIQPIIVRPMANSITYQIVAGERRWRACRILGMTEVPVIIREMDDFTAAQVAIIENIQRDDLNPVEEAMAYKELTNKYHMTQETLSRAMGKSRPYITNAMRLLTLPEPVVEKLRDGDITTGHAKALMAIESDADIISACNEIIANKLNVRQAEKLAQKYNEVEYEFEKFTREEKQMKNFYTEMELSLRERMLRKITIKGDENGKGKITLDFNSKDDLIKLTTCLMMIESGFIEPEKSDM